jgi:hypothetical protein
MVLERDPELRQVCPPTGVRSAFCNLGYLGTTCSLLNRKQVRYGRIMGMLYSSLQGTAMRYAAEKRDLATSIAELRKIAAGHDEVVAEAAGVMAGAWYASPATHSGHELIAAGMLILAAGGLGSPLDYEELERWTRVGYERGMAMRHSEPKS